MGGESRAISVTQLYKTKFKVMEFEGKFKATFGRPQMGGSWIIWGDSSNGKTSLAMQLAKYLTLFGKVIYNSFEEGVSLSFKNTLERNAMHEVAGRFLILNGEPTEAMIKRLRKRYSADIIIIDSIQHAGITKEDYKKLKNTFPGKLFIYISHAKGRLPKGEVADFIRYDSDLKIYVEGYRAFVSGRLNDSDHKHFDIWEEKAKTYYNEI